MQKNVNLLSVGISCHTFLVLNQIEQWDLDFETFMHIIKIIVQKMASKCYDRGEK